MKPSINTLRFMRAIIPIIGVLLIGMSTGSHLTYPLKDALSTALFIFGSVLISSLLLFSAVITRLRETHESFEEIDNNPNYTFKNQEEFNAALYTRVRRNIPDSTERKMILRDMMRTVSRVRLDKFIFYCYEAKFLSAQEFDFLRDYRCNRFGNNSFDCLVTNIRRSEAYDMANWVNRCYILFGAKNAPSGIYVDIYNFINIPSRTAKEKIQLFTAELKKELPKQPKIPTEVSDKILKYIEEKSK